MSSKERIRLEAFGRVKAGTWSVVRAAQVCGMSLRQARRVWKRYQIQGDQGLIHQGRGRAPNNRIDDSKRAKIVARYQERYADFGPTHACEKLLLEDLKISPDTLSRLLKEKDLWVRRRHRGKHRSRRERRSCLGSLLQMDGSIHDWFEGRGEVCCLMVAVDDATGRTLAHFYPRETTEAAFDLFGRWVARYGIPKSLYVDRAGIYRSDREATPEEVLCGKEPQTQFGRAMDELDVELILANSPQAKGRVERKNGVLQDRLVKEMRLQGISSMQAANAYLEKTHLAEHNAAFAARPREADDVHRPVSAWICMEEILCVREERAVGQDWCVRWKNNWLQIAKSHARLELAGKTVTVKQLAGGKLVLEHGGDKLQYTMVSSRPETPKVRVRVQVKNNKVWKPGRSHPWNRPSVAAPK
jgi:hypothetical protein